MSDSELVPRAVAGDPEARDALWQSHRRWVSAVLLAHRPAGEELADLLQEVAVVFLERLHELRDSARLRPWLRRVTINVARSSARRGRARRRHVAPLADDTLVVDPEPAERARRASAAARLERVLELAARLDADYREPLLLRAVEGLSQADIADVLQLPVTTVETRLARARRMLRRELASDVAPVRPVRLANP